MLSPPLGLAGNVSVALAVKIYKLSFDAVVAPDTILGVYEPPASTQLKVPSPSEANTCPDVPLPLTFNSSAPTTLFAILAVIAVVPLPVISPDSVTVSLPVK